MNSIDRRAAAKFVAQKATALQDEARQHYQALRDKNAELPPRIASKLNLLKKLEGDLNDAGFYVKYKYVPDEHNYAFVAARFIDRATREDQPIIEAQGKVNAKIAEWVDHVEKAIYSNEYPDVAQVVAMLNTVTLTTHVGLIEPAPAAPEK